MKMRFVILGFCVFLSSIFSLQASDQLDVFDSEDDGVVRNTASTSVPTTSFSKQPVHLSLGGDSPRLPSHLPRNNASPDVLIPMDQSSPLQGGAVLPVTVGGQPPVDPAVAHRRQEEERWSTGETFYYYLGAVNNNLGIFCTGAFTCLTTVAAGVEDPATKQILLYTLSGLGASATMFLYFGSKAAAAEKDRHDKLEAAYARDRAQETV